MSDPTESDRSHLVKSKRTRATGMVRMKEPHASVRAPTESDPIALGEAAVAATQDSPNGFLERASKERPAKEPTTAEPSLGDSAAAGRPVEDTAAMLSRRQWRWNLDAIAGSSVSGWVSCHKNADERVLVKVFLDDVLMASAVADGLRPDLISAGVSTDGKNGFDCRLPQGRLRDADMIVVTAEVSGEVVVLIRRDNSEGEVSPGPQGVMWYYDITDLLIYVIHHPYVSGIQRVQCGYLTNIIAKPDIKDKIRFCAQHPSTKDYFPVEKNDVDFIISSLNSDGPAEFEKRKTLALKIIETGARLYAPFSAGDFLIVLGATWMFKDYYRAILRTKRELGVKYFQVFYDAIPTYLPETCDVGLIDVFNRAMAGLLRYADGVLSISEFSAGELRRLAAESGAECPTIKTVPMGNDVDYASRKVGKRAARIAVGLSESLGEYVLCVGTVEPRKNHIYLYNLWKRLIQEFGDRTPKLVCVGRFGWHTEELQRYLRSTNNLNGNFIVLSGITDPELNRLYDGCLFTIFPSIYEGWGLPISESLAHGKLCVTSRVTSMSEAGGTWAEYLDPYSVEDGFRIVSSLIKHPDLVEEKEGEIRRTYKALSWESATDAFLTHLRELMSAASNGTRQPGSRVDEGGSRRQNLKLGVNYGFSNIVIEGDGLRTIEQENRNLDFFDVLEGADWNDPEDWGCWAEGPSARLKLTLPPEAPSELICYVHVQIPSFFGTRKCDVFVDRRLAGSYNLTDKGKHIKVRINGETPRNTGIQEVRYVKIELRLDKTVLPSEAGANDARSLGIGMMGLFICAATDYTARMDYLEEYWL